MHNILDIVKAVQALQEKERELRARISVLEEKRAPEELGPRELIKARYLERQKRKNQNA